MDIITIKKYAPTVHAIGTSPITASHQTEPSPHFVSSTHHAFPGERTHGRGHEKAPVLAGACDDSTIFMCSSYSEPSTSLSISSPLAATLRKPSQ